MRKIFAAVLLLPAVAYADPAPITKSISWYMDHPSELAVTMAACHDNSQLANTPTCVNVEAAYSGRKARSGPDLRAMLQDQRFWSANPIAREIAVARCANGTSTYPAECRAAGQSELQYLNGRK